MIRIFTERRESSVRLEVVLFVSLLLLPYNLGASNRIQCLAPPDQVHQRYLRVGDQPHNITLEISPRITHQLSTHIFRILLEEKLGYARVEIVTKDDYEAKIITERLQCITEIYGPSHIQAHPSTVINLEVPVPTDFIPLTIDPCVKEVGSISPPGHFGWFIPVKFKSKDVQQPIHWTQFRSKSFAANYDVEDIIYDKYHNSFSNKMNTCKHNECKNGWYKPTVCLSQPCATLLASDYENTKQVIEHIKQMRVYVKVVWLEPNLKTIITNLLSTKTKAFLLMSWTPSELVLNPQEFIEVTMKNCDFFNASSMEGCFYSPRRSVKYCWSELEKFAPEAFELLKQMNFFENGSYASLLNIYSKLKDYHTMEEIACHWLKGNRDDWVDWVPDPGKNFIYIGGIFPLSGSAYTGRGIVRGAKMAQEAINNNNSILQNYELNLLAADGQCRADKVMKAFIDYLTAKNYYSTLVGILGPACSETVEPLAGVSKFYKTITISYSAEGAMFTERAKYPYFFRTIGENAHYSHVYLELLKRMQWKKVVALSEDGQKYTEYISSMEQMLKDKHITIYNKKFSRGIDNNYLRDHLVDIQIKRYRIIIADIVDEVARNVMCEAYKLNMTAKQGYVWFLPTWLNATWYNTTYYNRVYNESINCSTAQMIEAINGYFVITHAYFGSDDQIMQENKTVAQWKREYYKDNLESSSYAGYAYDAVWTYAYALDKLLKDYPEAIANLHSLNVTEKLTQIIRGIDFYGVSGRIKFRGGSTRFSIINILQWYNNDSRIIGNFNPNVSDKDPIILGGTLTLNDSAIIWLKGGKPDDGTEPAEQCTLESLSKFLNVSCETAVIILNIFVVLFVVLVLLSVLIVLKRRYEKRVQSTEEYMKSLGLQHLLISHDYTGLDKWEIERESVVLNRKLGEGAFGTVYGGEANLPETGWTPVAVKTLKIGSTTEEKLDFLSEAEVMKRFDHKNIVKLLGVCTKIEPVYTIMEFMLYGDLKTYLLARRHLVNGNNVDETEEVSEKKLTAMALDVARGLSYLAQLKYVHRDVASRNCLLGAQRVVKLGDFGMTRPVFENDYYKFNRRGMLPVRWMAPESLALGVFTPASDVWSFGVLLYEIITFGSFPFQGLSNTEVLNHVKLGNTITIPQGVKSQLEILLKTCWSTEPKSRPTSSQIVDYLANNPRLICPCLDVPLSSVQMEDTGQLEMQLPDQFRKCSSSLSFKNLPLTNGISSLSIPSPTKRQNSVPDGGVSIPMENCCPKEPLLPLRSDSISGSSTGVRYVPIQNNTSDLSYDQDEHDDSFFTNCSGNNQHAISKV